MKECFDFYCIEILSDSSAWHFEWKFDDDDLKIKLLGSNPSNL